MCTALDIFDISHVEDAYNSSSTVTHVALSGYAIMLQEDHMEQALGANVVKGTPFPFRWTNFNGSKPIIAFQVVMKLKV